MAWMLHPTVLHAKEVLREEPVQRQTGGVDIAVSIDPDCVRQAAVTERCKCRSSLCGGRQCASEGKVLVLWGYGVFEFNN